MKVAVFDAFNGASGDMIVSSLLGVALSEEDLKQIVETLNLNVDFEVKEVEKSGVRAKRVEVREEVVERSFEEVVGLIQRSKIDEEVKRDAIGIFGRLHETERKIHGECKFHEVGSDDAIFDVVAAATGIRRLISRGYEFYATPVRLGSGFVEFSHGKYPVPTFATLEILKGSPIEVVFGGEGELLTPTAAAILAHYCRGVARFPLRVEEISYGAGKRDCDVPNVLRLILGEAYYFDSVFVLETSVDDVSGEVAGYAVEELRKLENVLDAWIVSGFGKKSRPIFEIKAVVKGDAERVASKMMQLTGSLGVRVLPVHHRMIARRKEVRKRVSLLGREFEVRFKASDPGFEHLKPEFDDVAAIAEKLEISPIFVLRELARAVEHDNSER
ncbi:MAG: nickel pincer cofactor biosynthesis protein LarC [Archaeoglobaceae archaeon]